VVDSEAYLLTLMRYIELNPVRAEMVSHPGKYRWSSYRANALGEDDADLHRVAPHGEYLRLGATPGQRQSAYRKLFRAAIAKDDLAEIRVCTHKGWALGDQRFRDQIDVIGQQRAASKGVGRPTRRLAGSRC